MSRQNKDTKSTDLTLLLVNGKTHETLWAFSRGRKRFIADIVLAAVLFLGLSFCIIAFTPVRSLIPGYPDARSRRDAVQTAIQVDSLRHAIYRWELYSENLLRVLDGEEPLRIDSVINLAAARALSESEKARLSAVDSVLRAQMDSLERSWVVPDDETENE